jgi:uncharacterized Fe-S cluster-containing radical SAM superfamily protein
MMVTGKVFRGGKMKKANYNPVKGAEDVAKVVCRDDLRKYRRFRSARFYGGIATADCVGCCLRCLFCWSWREIVNPRSHGHFHSAQKVAGTLIGIAHKKGFRQIRISGNEPTLGREHLIKVLELVPKDILFILETNGILIGHDKTYADDLARFENLYVRISLKGCNEKEFSMLTGAEQKGFILQLQALENLARVDVNVHPAVMVSFSSLENIEALKMRLGRIDRGFENFEIEELVLYGDIEKRLKRTGLRYATGYEPEHIPTEKV